MFNVSSTNRIHFVALYASYSTTVMTKVFSKLIPKFTTRIRLLTISSFVRADSEAFKRKEATTFDAKCHVRFFADTLPYYDQTLDEWCVFASLLTMPV